MYKFVSAETCNEINMRSQGEFFILSCLQSFKLSPRNFKKVLSQFHEDEEEKKELEEEEVGRSLFAT